MSRSASRESINSLDICVDGRCQIVIENGGVLQNPCSCWAKKTHDEFKEELDAYNYNYESKDGLVENILNIVDALEAFVVGNNKYGVLESEIESHYTHAVNAWNAVSALSKSWPDTGKKFDMILLVGDLYKKLKAVRVLLKARCDIELQEIAA